MNERVAGASIEHMESLELTPAQLALTQKVDGEAVEDVETAELRAIGRELRVAFHADVLGIVDVSEEVMLAVHVNDAVRYTIDVADEVMFAIALNEAVRREVDVSDDVMASIALNDAVRHPVDVADAVMADVLVAVQSNVLPMVRRMPRWASIGGPALLLAAAAAMIFAIAPTPAPRELKAQLVSPVFTLASLNRAEVEDVESQANVSLMQFEDGSPTILFIEERTP